MMIYNKMTRSLVFMLLIIVVFALIMKDCFNNDSDNYKDIVGVWKNYDTTIEISRSFLGKYNGIILKTNHYGFKVGDAYFKNITYLKTKHFKCSKLKNLPNFIKRNIGYFDTEIMLNEDNNQLLYANKGKHQNDIDKFVKIEN